MIVPHGRNAEHIFSCIQCPHIFIRCPYDHTPLPHHSLLYLPAYPALPVHPSITNATIPNGPLLQNSQNLPPASDDPWTGPQEAQKNTLQDDIQHLKTSLVQLNEEIQRVSLDSPVQEPPVRGTSREQRVFPSKVTVSQPSTPRSTYAALPYLNRGLNEGTACQLTALVNPHPACPPSTPEGGLGRRKSCVDVSTNTRADSDLGLKLDTVIHQVAKLQHSQNFLYRTVSRVCSKLGRVTADITHVSEQITDMKLDLATLSLQKNLLSAEIALLRDLLRPAGIAKGQSRISA
ncbi:hypothetical protein ACOMHN_021319 [Nucella lapillus]